MVVLNVLVMKETVSLPRSDLEDKAAAECIRVLCAQPNRFAAARTHHRDMEAHRASVEMYEAEGSKGTKPKAPVEKAVGPQPLCCLGKKVGVSFWRFVVNFGRKVGVNFGKKAGINGSGEEGSRSGEEGRSQCWRS
jgi:hypothetical protein